MNSALKKIKSLFRQRGGATAEFLFAAPALLLLGMSGMQALFFYDAKNTLSYAAFEAAREGAVTHAQTGNMRRELAVRLSPIFGGDGSSTEAVESMAEAMVEVHNPLFTKIQVLNPTKEAFDDFGVKNSENNKTEIPNDNLKFRSRQVGSSSGVNIQDANILKVKVTYGYKLEVPIINAILPSVLKWTDPGNIAYYAAGRIPVTAVATVRMQSPAWPDNNASADGGDDSGGAPPDNTDPGESQPPGGDDTNGGDDDSGSNTDDDSGSNNGGDDDNTGGSDNNGGSDDDTGNSDDSGDDTADGDDSGNNDDEEVECESTWDDEEYKTKECSGHWYCFATEFTSQLKAAANVVWDFVTGVMAGLKDQVADLWNLLTDPGVLLDLAKQFVEDPKATLLAIVEGLGEDVQKVLHCGPKDIGRIIGQNINPMTPIRVVSKLAKISGNSDLIKYADKLEKDIACASFPASTPVFTESGRINIEDISEGLRVKSRSQETFKDSLESVVAVISRTSQGYQRIKTENGEIKTTPEHPFWVQGKGWVEAKDIEWEDPIATANGDAVVYNNDYIQEPTRVYNFTVDETRTYFAGDVKAWVHNANCQVRYHKSDGKNKELNNPEPNTVYYVDGRHRYTTDEHGRTTSVKSTIREDDLDTGIRNCYQQGKAGSCGLDDDEGGHLIATKVGGPGEKINLVPQNMNLNRGKWKKMENEWAKRAANGENIEVEIEIIYDGDNPRPEKFIVKEVYDGVPQTPREFINQPGG
jgi:predicted RNA-binding protein YlqC (UPF0109 family)